MIPVERAHLFVAALSHKGMKKGKNNEDRYAISSFRLADKEETPALFAIVADGIGGHLAGEVAAEMVVDYVSEAVAESDGENPLDTIKEAVDAANYAVHHLAQEDENKQGMGSTCVCAWVIGNRLYTASVGDSRLYLMRGAKIRQLTTDHTWVQEALEKGVLTPEQARDHPNVHVIRQYIGAANPPDVDFRIRDEDEEVKEGLQGFPLQPGDRLLLCSDGLTDLVWDDEILEIVRSGKTLKSAAHELIDTANQRGGHDNITVILLSAPVHDKQNFFKNVNPLWWIAGGVVSFLVIAALLISFVFYLVQPPTTPTPTASQTPVATVTSLPSSPALFPTLTPTPAPTIGATHTPWPTNTPLPEPTNTPEE